MFLECASFSLGYKSISPPSPHRRTTEPRPTLSSGRSQFPDDRRRISSITTKHRRHQDRSNPKALPIERTGEEIEARSKEESDESSSTKHFVFVHGAGHGAWCWYKIRHHLELLGHAVTCIDLGGGGIDLNDPRKIESFEDYHKPLFDFMSSLPKDAKVVLVGHSVGGMNLTNAIHKFGEKVESAVYIAGMMIRNGYSDLKKQVDTQQVEEDKSKVDHRSETLRTSDGVLKPEYQRMLLYNLSPPEDATLASMLLRPFPKFQLQEGQFEGGPEMDKVKRVYVRTLNDKIFPLKYQDTMVDMWPPSQVISLESDHCPFFSFPSQLCDVLLNI